MRSTEISDMFRRICEQLGIAFSANRVAPSVADLESEGQIIDLRDELNVVGKHFGVRFREIQGSLKDLVNTVNDSGPVLVELGGAPDIKALVLKVTARGKLLVHVDGQDQVVPYRWLKQNLAKGEDGDFHWLLIKPMYAAGNASRVHFASDSSQPLTPLRRYIGFLRPDAQDLRTIVIFSLFIGLLSLSTPLAVEAVVNTIAFGRYLQPLVVLSLIVLIFLGFRAALNVLMTLVTEVLQRKLFVRTVEDLSYRLIRVPLSVWNKYHGPELANRFFDVFNIQKITSKLLLDSLMLVLQTVIGLTVLAFYHPFLIGYDVGLLILMTVVLYVMGRGAVNTAKEESQSKYETAAWLQEIVRHPSTYKFNGGLNFAINRADELAAQYIDRRQNHFRILLRQITFAAIVQAIAATALLALGGYLVIIDQMTLGQLVAAELIVTVILGSFAKLGKDLESYYDLMASIDKLGKLFDLPVEPGEKLQLVRHAGAYSVELVNFSLSSSGSAHSISFEAGAAYALVGGAENSRGKLINTMVGQVMPARGHVLLNGFRVDSLSSESLQSTIGLVRDIELFDATIDDNLRLGRENVGSDQASELVNRLGIGQKLVDMEGGLSTRLQVGGYPLSRGESIRLMLARAFISRPGVLLIDGLLDFLSDSDIVDVLERLRTFLSDTTLIISTGRRAIADWADYRVDLGQDPWEISPKGSPR